MSDETTTIETISDEVTVESLDALFRALKEETIEEAARELRMNKRNFNRFKEIVHTPSPLLGVPFTVFPGIEVRVSKFMPDNFIFCMEGDKIVGIIKLGGDDE